MSTAEIHKLINKLDLSVFGTKFTIHLNKDKIFVDPVHGSRLYLQLVYYSPCTKTGKLGKWSGRKWYLSSHMTEDEIVKTAYGAFKAAVEHEVMEGFTFENKVVFNPHVSFRDLLTVSDKETTRSNNS